VAAAAAAASGGGGSRSSFFNQAVHESLVSFLLTCPREPVRPMTFMTMASLMGPSCEREAELIKWRRVEREREEGGS
jgi:hypothetical protein